MGGWMRRGGGSVMMMSKAVCERGSRGALCPDTHPQLPLLKILGSAVYSASSFPACDRVGSKVSALNGAREASGLMMCVVSALYVQITSEETMLVELLMTLI